MMMLCQKITPWLLNNANVTVDGLSKSPISVFRLIPQGLRTLSLNFFLCHQWTFKRSSKLNSYQNIFIQAIIWLNEKVYAVLSFRNYGFANLGKIKYE